MESWSVSVISDFSDPSASPTSTATDVPSASPSSTQKPTAEPSPTAIHTPFGGSANANLALEIIGAIVIVAVVAIGLLVYFRKRRNSHE
jgi:hypothetical protein